MEVISRSSLNLESSSSHGNGQNAYLVEGLAQACTVLVI